MENITLINMFEEELYDGLVPYMQQLLKIVIFNDDIHNPIFF